jgi:PAS domain S-box-containing protein
LKKEDLSTEEINRLIQDLQDRILELENRAENAAKQRETEKALRESEQKYRTLFEELTDAAILVDAQTGTIIDVNHEAEILTGYSREQLIGMHQTALRQDEPLPEPGELTKENYQDASAELKIQRQDGSIVPVTFKASLLRLENRNYVLSIFRDVTQRKRTETALIESERRYRGLFETMAEGVIVLDPDGRIISANPAARRILRMELKEGGHFKSESWQGMRLNNGPAAINNLDIYPQIKARQSIKNYELKMKRADGSETWINTNASPIMDAKGRMEALVITFSDITERKRWEKALQQSEGRLKALLNNTQQAFVLVDKEGRVQAFNTVMARLTRLHFHALIKEGDPIIDFIQPGDQENFLHHLKLCLEDGEIISLERNFIDQQGRENWLAFNYNPVTSENGEIIGLSLSILDVTERQLAERALLQANNELERRVEERTAELIRINEQLTEQIAEREKAEEALREARDELEMRVNERTQELQAANEEIKRFAYIVSHDLRAPLLNIKGFSGELQHALDDLRPIIKRHPAPEGASHWEQAQRTLLDDIPEALEFILSSADRMNYLLEAILRLSRIGRRELYLETLNMDDVVQNILDSLAHQIAQREVEIVVKPLPPITADPTAIQQIMGNILTNAVNYLDPSRPGKIRVWAEKGPTKTTFYVKDNGYGIEEHNKEKVFDLFRRAGHEQIEGEGIGLAYVHALIRRHNGRIGFESEAGSGTTFWFYIPHLNDSPSHEEGKTSA